MQEEDEEVIDETITKPTTEEIRKAIDTLTDVYSEWRNWDNNFESCKAV